MPSLSKETSTVYCPRCVYFTMTWDPRTPYGCRAWGIKSRQHPSLGVCASSGYPCQFFREKKLPDSLFEKEA